MSRLKPEHKESLKEIGDSLDALRAEDITSDKSKLSNPMNKLRRFLKALKDNDSVFNQALSGVQKGMELARKVGRTYNKFAQWLALPQVPDFFLEEKE